MGFGIVDSHGFKSGGCLRGLYPLFVDDDDVVVEDCVLLKVDDKRDVVGKVDLLSYVVVSFVVTCTVNVATLYN